LGGLVLQVLVVVALLLRPDATGDPLGQLEDLLADPASESAAWRTDVWRQVRVLEHSQSPLVLAGWRALAESGNPPDRANLLLYQRRHGGLSDWDNPLESAEVAVEWSLGLWGNHELLAADSFLAAASLQFPGDARFRDNLGWLRMEAPNLNRQDDQRAVALQIMSRKKCYSR